MCLGWWVSGAIAWTLHLTLIEFLALAGAGHLITLIREKFLPCSSCEAPHVTGFTLS